MLTFKKETLYLVETEMTLFLMLLMVLSSIFGLRKYQMMNQ